MVGGHREEVEAAYRELSKPLAAPISCESSVLIDPDGREYAVSTLVSILSCPPAQELLISFNMDDLRGEGGQQATVPLCVC